MTVNCLRCHVRCQTGTPNPAARILRVSADKGYCPNCAVTEFFKNPDIGLDLNWVLKSTRKKPADALRLPHIRRMFARVLAAGHAQVPATEIDWDEVIANWDLPFPRKRGRA